MAKVYAKARNDDPSLPFNERKMTFASGRGFAVDIRVRNWRGHAAQRYAEGVIIGFWESEDDARRVAYEVNTGVAYGPGHQFHGLAHDAIVVPAWNAPADTTEELPWETPDGSAAIAAVYESAGVLRPRWLSKIVAAHDRMSAVVRATPSAEPDGSKTSDSAESSSASSASRESDAPGRIAVDRLIDELSEIQPEIYDGRPAPYQFLVLLHAIAGARAGQPRLRPYQDVKRDIGSLLAPFKLAGSAPNPANPWFALRNSSWWEMLAPMPATYKEVNEFNSIAGLSIRAYQAVTDDSSFAVRAVQAILDLFTRDPEMLDVVVTLGLAQAGIIRVAMSAAPMLVPVERQRVEQFSVELVALGAKTRERREAKLQREYQRYLESQGHKVLRYQIPVDGQLLYTDLHDVTADELIEVKASVDRVTMRLALGQVLDYARLLSPQSGAVLVPEQPPPGIVDLFSDHGIRVIWPTKDGQYGSTDTTD